MAFAEIEGNAGVKFVYGEILELCEGAAVLFENCAGDAAAAEEADKFLKVLTEGEIVGESSGILFEISLTIAGVSAICTRKGIVGGFVSGILYIIVGIFGVQNTGVYAPLMMNGIIAFICAFVFILTSILMLIKKKNNNVENNENPIN